tara:strand:- start:35 stop:1054 length:1020 start_codon:yes stop_codon:yes gene_type:complete
MITSVKSNFPLKKFNTFNISAKAKYFFEFLDELSLLKILKNKKYKNEKLLILGGGSNLLFSRDYDGIILKNSISGIKIISEDKNSLIVEVGAGENWHDFVIWSVEKNLSGIENLALIPGLVGASPIQNIGAYGMEVKDTIIQVTYIDIKTGIIKTLKNNECDFSYRNSIFKKELKNKIVITRVTFKLSKKDLNITKYGAIKYELESLQKLPSCKSICQAVINIRTRKLPDPNKLGNSGSFFKNPIISNEKFKNLQKEFPEIVAYKEHANKMKVAAGWLIDKAGWKGYKKNNVGVYKNQALVLINLGGATGQEIINLSKEIQKSIFKKFKIEIFPEVNII